MKTITNEWEENINSWQKGKVFKSKFHSTSYSFILQITWEQTNQKITAPKKKEKKNQYGMRDTYFLASFQSLLFCEERNAGAVFGDWDNETEAGDLKQEK